MQHFIYFSGHQGNQKKFRAFYMETLSSKNSTQKPQNGQQKQCVKKSSQVLLASLQGLKG